LSVFLVPLLPWNCMPRNECSSTLLLRPSASDCLRRHLFSFEGCASMPLTRSAADSRTWLDKSIGGQAIIRLGTGPSIDDHSQGGRRGLSHVAQHSRAAIWPSTVGQHYVLVCISSTTGPSGKSMSTAVGLAVCFFFALPLPAFRILRSRCRSTSRCTRSSSGCFM